MRASRKAYMSVYYSAHSEQIKATSKAWDKANPEKVKARVSAYYYRNKNKLSDIENYQVDFKSPHIITSGLLAHGEQKP